MAKQICVIYIALVLLWMVCITTQSDRLEKSLKKRSKIPGTFRNLYFLVKTQP